MRKGLLLSILIVFLWTPKLLADTYVSGTIVNETWTLTGSPYYVEGNIIASNLTVKPGVQIEFLGDYRFEVAGLINAEGSQAERIVFTNAKNNTSGWQGLKFDNSVLGSILEWCEFKEARSSALHLINSVPEIRNCSFIGNRGDYGGAIRATIKNGDLIVEKSRFFNNGAEVAGGAIWADLDNGKLMVDTSSFRANKANPGYDRRNASGGAVFLKGDGSFLNCDFSKNEANSYTIYTSSGRYTRGGALWLQDGQSTVTACRFLKNRCKMTAHSQTPDWSYPYGGAVFLYSGSILFENSLFAESYLSAQRRTAYKGSAIYVNAGNCSLVNSTVTENITTSAIYNHGGTLQIRNTIVYFNNASGTQISGAASVSYSDIQGGWFSGDGNIDVNPILDLEYKVVLGSPAIDAGHPDIEYEDAIPHGLGLSRNDMGFLGGPKAYLWEGLKELEGACCRENGSCIHAIEFDCISARGYFQGIGTDCSSLACENINQPPIAKVGVEPSRRVFDEITLNASSSYDPDGIIVDYSWQLLNESNSDKNKTAEGVSPTISNLAPGFYNVILSVTDDGDAISVDEMSISAIGIKGDLNLDGDVDGLDLSEFAEIFGFGGL